MAKTKKQLVLTFVFGLLFLASSIFAVKNLMPKTNASASEHSHCFCGAIVCDKPNHDDTLEWTAWDGKSNIETSGNYYLSDNVSATAITADITISANANLCLNGKSLDLGAFRLVVDKNATVNFADCKGEGKILSSTGNEIDYYRRMIQVSGTANIYGGTYENQNGYTNFTIQVGEDNGKYGVLNIYGGTLTAKNNVRTILNYGLITQYGGKITGGAKTGNDTQIICNGTPHTNVLQNGGTSYATFTMEGGEISAHEEIAYPYGTILSVGTFNLKAGTIDITSKSGAALYTGWYGKVNMTGGSITVANTQNSPNIIYGIGSFLPTNGNYGSAPVFNNKGYINISGGTIHLKDSVNAGYAVWGAINQIITITGGTIKKDSDSRYLIGVMDKLYISGEPTLIGGAFDITIVEGKVQYYKGGYHYAYYYGEIIAITEGKFYTGRKLLVDATKKPVGEYVVKSLEGQTHAEKFEFVLGEKLTAEFDSSVRALKIVPKHGHCWCGVANCTSTEGHYYTTVQFLPTESTNEFITTTDIAYLNDVLVENETIVNSTFCLCLNGNTLDGNNNVKIGSYSTVTICDCTKEGVLKNIIVKDNASLCIYGGKIEGITLLDNGRVDAFGGLYKEKYDYVTPIEGYTWMENTDPETCDEYPFTIARLVTITFDANGGEGEMEPMLIMADKATKLNKNTFVKPGYKFVRWETWSGGTKVYSDEANIKTNTSLDLYAVWEIANDTPYKIEHYFEDFDGNFVLDESKIQYKTGRTFNLIIAGYLSVDGFVKDTENANTFASGQILANGNQVFKLYYKRTVHNITIVSSNTEYGNVSLSLIENVKYGTPIVKNGLTLIIGNVVVEVSILESTETNRYYLTGFENAGDFVNGDLAIVANVIMRMPVAMPQADTTNFMYTGSEITYNIALNDKYTVAGNQQTNVGKYTVVVSLIDKENYEWTDGLTADLTFEFVIKAVEQSYVEEGAPEDAKPSVVVSTPNGLAPDVALVVVDKTEDPEVVKKILETASVKVEKIFDISLEKNGDNIQVSEVGGLITIKILLDEELKAKDLILYHIHAKEAPVEIVRGEAGKVNQYVVDGDYAVITIDRLSEFAFVTAVPNDFPVWAIAVGAVVLIAGAIIIAYLATKKRKA